MTILTGEEIKNSDIIQSHCIDLETQIQPGGLDLTLHAIERFSVGDTIGVIDFDNSKRVIPVTFPQSFYDQDRVFLGPGVYKIHLHPILKIPMDCMAFSMPRSTVTRCGCGIHGGFWDPGYIGDSQVLFEVYHPNGVYLHKNARIIQIVFVKMTKDAKDAYDGIYQGQGLPLPIKCG